MESSAAPVEDGAAASRAAGAVDSPVADMRGELASHVAWSAATPHGLRGAAENVDAALRRSRREVLRTVAAMKASGEELGSAKHSRLAQPSSTGVRLPRCGPRKALYPRSEVGHFKTMHDLAASPPAQMPGDRRKSRTASCSPSPFTTPEATSGDGAVVRSDPRLAVAEKHRAAVEVVRPQIPVCIERSLRDHTRCLGAVKPYGLSRRARREDIRIMAQPAMNSNEHYIDRMQCCRPSKGLYVYYEGRL